MKQSITLGQLSNLTIEQKERLGEWWKPRPFDHYVNQNMDHFFVGYTVDDDKFVTHGDDIPHDKDGSIPILSIGQMIQFIQEKKPLLKGISKNRFDKWFVNIDNGMLGYKDELCDALWETVKQLLKENPEEEQV